MLKSLSAALLLCLLGGAVALSLRDDIDYSQLDPLVREDIRALDARYDATPFYAVMGGQKWFVVRKGTLDTYDSLFLGVNHYGLADGARKEVLPPLYDKLGNPGLTVAGCLEIFLKGKVGLVQHQTGKVLEPQFELLIPAAQPANGAAWALKAGQWHKVEATASGFTVTAAEYSPVEALKKMRFDAMKVPQAQLWVDSYYYPEEQGALVGKGSCITPSWLWKLGSANEWADCMLLPGQKQEWADASTDKYQIQAPHTNSISEKVTAFITSFIDEGISGRPYALQSTQLVTYHSGKKAFEVAHMGKTYQLQQPFRTDSSYTFLNDSVAEARYTRLDYAGKGTRYLSEPVYQYFGISQEGKIASLVTNRYYTFTKFAEIDESYFVGRFAWYINPAEQSMDGGDNIWLTDHLSLDDLDLMRNEIFADYGLRFKTAKWQDYFGKQPWYKPLHDDVNAFLSPIDRHNLAVILRVRAKLAANEAALLNKRQAAYYPAG